MIRTCFSKFIPLQVFISFTSWHTDVDVLFSHLHRAISLLFSHSPYFYSAPSSHSLFSPCKTLSYSLWRNKMKLWSDFKVLLCRSAARWSTQQTMCSTEREKKPGKSIFLGLLMSYKLENTDSSGTSPHSHPKDWECVWLRWWAQAFPEHRIEQRLLNRVTIVTHGSHGIGLWVLTPPMFCMHTYKMVPREIPWSKGIVLSRN